MAPLTAARPHTDRLGNDVLPPLLSVPLATTTVYAGGMAMLDAGYAKPAAAAVGKLILGRFETTVVNAGSPGAKSVDIRRGIFKWNNSESGEAIAQAQVGSICYAVDDQTVGKTSASGTLSAAGVVVGILTDGVLVQMGLLSQAEMDAQAAAAVANVPALTGTPTGTANGSIVDVAATAGSCAGGAEPSAANVDTAIATAVASIVLGVNEQNKEFLTKINALLTAAVNAGWMAAP